MSFVHRTMFRAMVGEAPKVSQTVDQELSVGPVNSNHENLLRTGRCAHENGTTAALPAPPSHEWHQLMLDEESVRTTACARMLPPHGIVRVTITAIAATSVMFTVINHIPADR